MMDFQSEREERDNYLVITTVVGSASQMLNGFQAWSREELKQLIRSGESISKGFDGQTQRLVFTELKRLRDIEQYELPEAVKTVQDKIKEVSEGAYDSVVDARRYLEEGLYRFESLVRELLNCRRLFDELVPPDMMPPSSNGQEP